jgi:pyridoxal phosphate enzyme (YggS family)
MGVSKFQPPEAVEAAWRWGLRLFGENRVQEAAGKFEGLHCPGLELHLIGSLQRNKAKTAVSLFDCVQSVDRDELIDHLGNLSAQRESPLSILLEFHCGEESKAGYPEEDDLFRAAERALAFPGLRIQGLMTMAPNTQDKAPVRAAFRRLAAAREALRARFPDSDWQVLSMGMSGDFETAIEEGSTLVRIGTAIFGARPG